MRVLSMPSFSLANVLSHVAKDHPDWSPARLVAAENSYRQFLALCKESKGEATVPTEDADVIWHHHILHTKQYMDDCQSYLGWFLHHNPMMPTADMMASSRSRYRSIGEELTTMTMCNGNGGDIRPSSLFDSLIDRDDVRSRRMHAFV